MTLLLLDMFYLFANDYGGGWMMKWSTCWDWYWMLMRCQKVSKPESISRQPQMFRAHQVRLYVWSCSVHLGKARALGEKETCIEVGFPWVSLIRPHLMFVSLANGFYQTDRPCWHKNHVTICRPRLGRNMVWTTKVKLACSPCGTSNWAIAMRLSFIVWIN